MTANLVRWSPGRPAVRNDVARRYVSVDAIPPRSSPSSAAWTLLDWRCRHGHADPEVASDHESIGRSRTGA